MSNDIKRVVEESGLTKADFAKRIGFSRRTLQRYLSKAPNGEAFKLCWSAASILQKEDPLLFRSAFFNERPDLMKDNELLDVLDCFDKRIKGMEESLRYMSQFINPSRSIEKSCEISDTAQSLVQSRRLLKLLINDIQKRQGEDQCS